MIVILAILTQWLYQPLYDAKYNYIIYLNKFIDTLRIKINTNTYLRFYLKYFPRWLFILLFIFLVWIIYIYSFKIHYIFDYILCLFCISMPLQAPWQIDMSKNKTLFESWRELFILSGKDMIEQNISINLKQDSISHLEEIHNKYTNKSANLEICSKIILKMWCYCFFLPLFCLMLPYGTIIAFSWILTRYTLIYYEKISYLYFIEYIPLHIILLISAMLGNFESCISATNQAKNLQKNSKDYTLKYNNNWLFNGIKGAINIDVIISNYNYQQFLTFMAKLVLAMILLYLFTFFI